MNKLLKCIFLLILISNNLLAKGKLIYFAYESSYGYSQYVGGYNNKNQEVLKPSYTFGLASGFYIAKNRLLNISLNWERKGTKLVVKPIDKFDPKLNTITVLENFSYLSIPILYEFKLFKNKRGIFKIGPAVEYLFKNKEYINIPNIYEITNNNTHIYKKIGINLVSSIGYEIKLKNKIFIGCELKNNIGLTNIIKKDSQINYTYSINATFLAVSLKYYF